MGIRTFHVSYYTTECSGFDDFGWGLHYDHTCDIELDTNERDPAELKSMIHDNLYLHHKASDGINFRDVNIIEVFEVFDSQN